MPSGFTSDLYDGKDVTFEQFVLRCARGMGALIMMRDQSPDAPIPERFEANTSYHDERIAEAEATLAWLDSATPEEVETAAGVSNTERQAFEDEAEAGRIAVRKRYEDMLVQVEAWTPPTDDHENFKNFMIKQLEDSIEWDTGHKSDFTPFAPAEWAERKRQEAERDITYSTKHKAEEIARNDERNAWVSALRESLKSG